MRQRRQRNARAMSGLGLMEPTPTGVRFSEAPTCITPTERAEAKRKCTQLRGLAGSSPMTGRLAAYDACRVKDLPDCGTPSCLDDQTARLIEACIAGRRAHPDFDCGSLYTAALAQLPLCATPRDFPILGNCLHPNDAAVRDYCAGTNAQGPDRVVNGACWRVMHATEYWARAKALPLCPPGSPPAPPPPAYPPPDYLPPSAPPPPGYPPSTTDDGGEGPESSEASMMGIGGFLALVAAAGTGYYLYRRYKR